MNTSGKCGACGTPKSKNNRNEDDCPKCNSENFFGFNIPEKEILIIKKEPLASSLILEDEDIEIENEQ